MSDISPKQRHVLEGLRAAHPHTPSARNLADRLDKPHFRSKHYGRAEVYGALTQLEGRGLVTRIGSKPIQWAPRSF